MLCAGHHSRYGVLASDARNGSSDNAKTYEAPDPNHVAPLAAVQWWRVILDESHMIKSGGKATDACMALVSDRKWCVTGTPIQTNVSDLSSQLAFVGLESTAAATRGFGNNHAPLLGRRMRGAYTSRTGVTDDKSHHKYVQSVAGYWVAR